MLSHSIKVKDNDLFRIPFGGIMPWSDFVDMYPELYEAMDGLDITSCLDFYYSMNPINDSYEFKDENSENDIADIIGLNTVLIQQGETKEDEIQRKERIESIANFMISVEDRKYLVENGISEEEYLKYTNENSVSFESDKGSNGKRKQKISKTEKDKILSDKKSTKEAKLERRKIKLLERESSNIKTTPHN